MGKDKALAGKGKLEGKRFSSGWGHRDRGGGSSSREIRRILATEA